MPCLIPVSLPEKCNGPSHPPAVRGSITAYPRTAYIFATFRSTMNINKTFWPAAAAFALFASCGQGDAMKEKVVTMEAPPPVVPMQDFFKNPEKSGYRISPNGEYFSYRAPWHNTVP